MKYVYFIPTWQTTAELFDGIEKVDDVFYSGSICTNSFIRKIIASSINGKLSFFPGKHFYRHFIVNLRISESTTFIFMGGFNIMVGFYYIDYLRKKWPNSLFIAYFTDINNLNKYDVDQLKEKFDAVSTFSENEAIARNIHYCGLPIPHYRRSDLVFVGQGKDRLKELIRLYDFLGEKGIICNFVITNVPQEEQVIRKGIEYTKSISHIMSLIYLLSSSCVLELASSTTKAHSDRVEKAVVFNKKILSNNKCLREYPYYKNELIQIYENVEDIDVSFLKGIDDKKYDYNGELSLEGFIKKIREIASLSEKDR